MGPITINQIPMPYTTNRTPNTANLGPNTMQQKPITQHPPQQYLEIFIPLKARETLSLLVYMWQRCQIEKYAYQTSKIVCKSKVGVPSLALGGWGYLNSHPRKSNGVPLLFTIFGNKLGNKLTNRHLSHIRSRYISDEYSAITHLAWVQNENIGTVICMGVVLPLHDKRKVVQINIQKLACVVLNGYAFVLSNPYSSAIISSNLIRAFASLRLSLSSLLHPLPWQFQCCSPRKLMPPWNLQRSRPLMALF